MSVCYHASCYIPHLYIQSEASWDSLQALKDLYYLVFAENVVFGRYMRLDSFLTRNTPVVLETASYMIEPLARSDDYLK